MDCHPAARERPDCAGICYEPFDTSRCAVLEEYTPAVVSFHFGLPAEPLVSRIRNAGARIMSTATTVEEAKWLADNGCDAVIAQG